MKADGLEDGYKVLADFNGTVEQMTEIYRCCADSVDGDFFELTGEQEKMIRSVQQQIEECVPDLDERIRQQEEALEQVAQEQTM